MTSQARNQNPLHSHTAHEMRLYPWTQDTLSAHLTHLHGVDELPLDRSLENLAALHDALNHGKPAKTDEQIYEAALRPERRYKTITVGPAKWGQPDDVALFFEDANGNGTNVVNLRPGDMPVLRAAVASPAAASEVISFLEGRDSGVLPSAKHRAIRAVLEILRDEEPV